MAELDVLFFFLGLFMFALGFILVITTGNGSAQWWMWLLLVFGILLILVSIFIWAFEKTSQIGIRTGKSSGLLSEAEEAAIFA